MKMKNMFCLISHYFKINRKKNKTKFQEIHTQTQFNNHHLIMKASLQFFIKSNGLYPMDSKIKIKKNI